MEKDLKGRSKRSKTVHSNMAALERDDERLDPSTRVLKVLARISKTRLPNQTTSSPPFFYLRKNGGLLVVYCRTLEMTCIEAKQRTRTKTRLFFPYIDLKSFSSMKFLFSKIIEKVSAVLSLDKWGFSFYFFFYPFCGKMSISLLVWLQKRTTFQLTLLLNNLLYYTG